jgi:outer membrane protein
LKQAQEIALRNHPRISQAELEALASKQVVNEVRAGFFPNVTFNATAVDAFESNTRLAAGGLNNPSVFDRNAEGLTATQLLTDFGRTAHLLNSSQLYSRAQDANAEATREQILLQVEVAFFCGAQGAVRVGGGPSDPGSAKSVAGSGLRSGDQQTSFRS